MYREVALVISVTVKNPDSEAFCLPACSGCDELTTVFPRELTLVVVLSGFVLHPLEVMTTQSPSFAPLNEILVIDPASPNLGSNVGCGMTIKSPPTIRVSFIPLIL
jgi:hypothetical protein